MKEIKNINQLIQINSDGVYTARFADIRDCLEIKFKEIYGIDVDTDPATADGQYINMWALLINNLFQLIQYGYKQTDPTTATGKYLDLLCAFNNIRRIESSKSKVNAWIKNLDNDELKDIENIEFVDVLGRRWKWTNPVEQFSHQKAVSFPSKKAILIRNIECLTEGPIIIKGAGDYDGEKELKEWKHSSDISNHGYLRPSKGNSFNFAVWQEKDSIAGTDEESDDELRVRRNDYFRNANSSVIDTLKGNILALDGVEDCFIFENDSDKTIDLNDYFENFGSDTIKDKQEVQPHSIYICVKYDYGDKNYNCISDYDIGSVIYSKLIPGCRTCKYTNSDKISGETREYHIKTNSEVTYPIYWKKVYNTKLGIIESNLNKGIKIELKCVKGDKVNNNGYNFATETLSDGQNQIKTNPHLAETDVEKKIRDNILEYLNGVKLGETVNASVLANAVVSADIKKNNMPTFFVESSKLKLLKEDNPSEGVDNYILPLCSFEYSGNDVTFQYILPTSETDYYVKCVIFISQPLS